VSAGIGAARWLFVTPGGFQAELFVTGGDVIVRDTAYEVVCRWTSASISEHDQFGQALDIWVDGVKGTPTTFRAENLASADCNVYLGSSPNLDSTSEYADGHIRFVTIDVSCPTEDVLMRI